MIVGDPGYVVAEIERQHEQLGFGNLLGTFHHGSAPHDVTTRSLELFADEVLSEIRKLG